MFANDLFLNIWSEEEMKDYKSFAAFLYYFFAKRYFDRWRV